MTSERGTRAHVSYHEFATPEVEAKAIVENIIAHEKMGIPWQEQAVLLRMNAMTRAVEMEMVRSQVPYRLVSGSSFFALREAKILLAYLRVATNRASFENFKDCLTYPPRKIGKAFTDKVQDAFKDAKAGQDWVAAAISQRTQLRDFQQRELDEWEKLLVSLRSKIKVDIQPGEILIFVESCTGMKDWFYGSGNGGDEDNESGSNLDEVVSFADQFVTSGELLDAIEEAEAFRAANARKRHAVPISTVHKAKGAEWKVVYLIQVGDSLFPARSEGGIDMTEERRLFYVAVTRPKDELWISKSHTSGLRSYEITPGPTTELTPVGTQMGFDL
jgi:DNA helicase-2/ATP-dependent DNA helicase PcrA